jgi:3-dehydroquinate dehydratase type I
VCKIVTAAKHPRDNLTILSFVESNASTSRLVSFAMGQIGIPSRVLATLYGAEFTFASLGEESQTAEGQLSIDNLRKVWQILGVS